MHKLLSKLWERRAKLAKAEKGFTLIELLVVVVILGVLIAIAIPLYLNYRKGANDAAAQSDLKNAINVMELCSADNGHYPIVATPAAQTGNVVVPSDTGSPACTRVVNLSTGTSLTYTSSTGVTYMITDTNNAGTPKIYCYNSANGGPVKAVTTATC